MKSTTEYSHEGDKLVKRVKTSRGHYITKYDTNGNEIYFSSDEFGTTNPFESWIEYNSENKKESYSDTRGLKISWSYKDTGDLSSTVRTYPDGREIRAEYDGDRISVSYGDYQEYNFLSQRDPSGKVAHFKDSTGLEFRDELNSDGKVIHRLYSDGSEEWREYDKDGLLNCSHFRTPENFDYWLYYTKEGFVAHYRDSNGFEKWLEYDDTGKITHCKDSNGFESWSEYDGSNLISYKNSDGFEFKYETRGTIDCEKIYRYPDGFEYDWAYNSKSNEVAYSDSSGFEYKVCYGPGATKLSVWHNSETYTSPGTGKYSLTPCDRVNLYSPKQT